MRVSLSRPTLSTSIETATLSTESRFTTHRRLIGSSLGSSTTSLGSPLIVVVHGAIKARRSRAMAASRERTTTGRRGISGNSPHQTSARQGGTFTIHQWRSETQRDFPNRPAHRWGLPHMPHTQHRFQRCDCGAAVLPTPHQIVWRRSPLYEAISPHSGVPRPPLY
jgi:hypothetical protein